MKIVKIGQPLNSLNDDADSKDGLGFDFEEDIPSKPLMDLGNTMKPQGDSTNDLKKASRGKGEHNTQDDEHYFNNNYVKGKNNYYPNIGNNDYNDNGY